MLVPRQSVQARLVLQVAQAAALVQVALTEMRRPKRRDRRRLRRRRRSNVRSARSGSRTRISSSARPCRTTSSASRVRGRASSGRAQDRSTTIAKTRLFPKPSIRFFPSPIISAPHVCDIFFKAKKNTRR
ncbi:unnamed protein product, partial [Nesidiocoris tenuis]